MNYENVNYVFDNASATTDVYYEHADASTPGNFIRATHATGRMDVDRFRLIARLNQDVLLPIICTLGMVGLIISAFILIKESRRRFDASGRFVSALLLCNFAYLATLCINWFQRYSDYSILNQSRYGCKILTYINSSSEFLSQWICLILSVINFLKTFYRAQNYGSCSHLVTNLLLVILTLTAVFYNVWVLVLYDIEVEMTLFFRQLCSVPEHFQQAFSTMLVLDVIFGCIVPSGLCLLICGLVLGKMRHNAIVRTRRRTSSATDVDYPVIAPETENLQLRTMVGSDSARSRDDFCNTKLQRITYRTPTVPCTLTMVVVFILLGLPVCGCKLIDAIFNVQFDTNFNCFKLIAYVMMRTQHAVVFWIYLAYNPTLVMRIKKIGRMVGLCKAQCNGITMQGGHY